MTFRGFLTVGLLLATGCNTLGPGSYKQPSHLFADRCAFCHGANGEGNDEFRFPAIAGLPTWYVEAQLVKFKGGIRGAHADDVNGLKMRPMARALDEDAIAGVAEYVSSLPPQQRSLSVVQGDSAKGKALYTPCTACHGPDGKGNEQLKAPPIVQLDDWYVADQLHKFKHGVRGVNPKDVTGNQMRPMAAALPDEQAIADVVSYLGTL